MQMPYTTYQDIRLHAADAYRGLIERSKIFLLRDGMPQAFSERHIQCVWFDPAYRPTQLRTRSGETVEVLDAGRWNREAGPDFLDATLQIKPGLRRVQGDVEIHIHPADWEHHGHAGDPRYDRVVAHVTYYPGLGPPAGLPNGTLEIALEDALKATPALRLEQIDTTAYPLAARMQSCTCAILLKEQTSVHPQDLLHAAGCYRFEQKAQAMRLSMQHGHVSDLLYHKTMEAMGYKQHRENFLRLASLVPLSRLQGKTPMAAYAILLGTAGLLPETSLPGATNDTRRFVRKVWDLWWQHQGEVPANTRMDWKGPTGRPTNNPARRLAAIAMLFTRIEPWRDIHTALQNNATAKPLQSLFVPDDHLSFWLHHSSFGAKPFSKQRALVGPDRLAAWVNNVVLPIEAATGTPIASLLSLYMPEQINAIIRQTATQLLGRDHNPALYRKAGILQQGLIQIFQDFCGGGCHACALADALQQGVFSPSAHPRPNDSPA